MVFRLVCAAAVIGVLFLVSPGWSQVVRFRHQTTDLDGNPVDFVTVGDEFLLQTYTQHVGGFQSAANAGVYAGYLDISYDPSMATVSGAIEHGPLYSNGKNGDLSVAGLLDNIGGFSSSGEDGLGLDPIGLDEHLLFSLPMRAEAVGELWLVGSESLLYPYFDVLVYGENFPVPAKDIDFGEADLRIDFGAVALTVRPVPEPSSYLLFALGVVMVTRLRRTFSRCG